MAADPGGAATTSAAGTAGPVMFAVVDDGLGRPAAFLGVLAAIQGAGSVVAGFSVGPLLRKATGQTVIAAGTLFVVVGLVARASGTVAVVALGSFGVGNGEWTLLREDPDFHQRFVASVANDRIQGRWDAPRGCRRYLAQGFRGPPVKLGVGA